MTEEMVRLSMWIPAESKEFILRVSAEQKVSQTEVIRNLLMAAKHLYEESESKALMLFSVDLNERIEFYRRHIGRVQGNIRNLQKQLKTMVEEQDE